MVLPNPDTPLYNHPLPEIENWLVNLGCQQDRDRVNCWRIKQLQWEAEICLEIEEIAVRYINALEGNRDVVRSFKYSLSREDIEAAVFSGP
ncbi:DUF3143 domain-containing protein [Spirulina sp. CS-785/01]|uniref:DUF3143 domain-containing protein n=1 Tax=Spirulina sp. CS-785/01 TaxID=3021716 RepID=UPI00232E4BAB|nr:DUF3143 domain-containing protein [Spirulina sp. CS-785/01]MDB9315254.1 DUF3143 domain-containing protein [Spirulina sp. CS-785/01]